MLVGKPTLVWPFFADQTMNGYRLEYELGMGKCMGNTDLTNERKIISTDEIKQYLNGMFDEEEKYVRNSRQARKLVLRASKNSSRLYFEEIIKTVNSQVWARKKKHNEL